MTAPLPAAGFAAAFLAGPDNAAEGLFFSDSKALAEASAALRVLGRAAVATRPGQRRPVLGREELLAQVLSAEPSSGSFQADLWPFYSRCVPGTGFKNTAACSASFFRQKACLLNASWSKLEELLGDGRVFVLLKIMDAPKRPSSSLDLQAPRIRVPAARQDKLLLGRDEALAQKGPLNKIVQLPQLQSRKFLDFRFFSTQLFCSFI